MFTYNLTNNWSSMCCSPHHTATNSATWNELVMNAWRKNMRLMQFTL